MQLVHHPYCQRAVPCAPFHSWEGVLIKLVIGHPGEHVIVLNDRLSISKLRTTLYALNPYSTRNLLAWWSYDVHYGKSSFFGIFRLCEARPNKFCFINKKIAWWLMKTLIAAFAFYTSLNRLVGVRLQGRKGDFFRGKFMHLLVESGTSEGLCRNEKWGISCTGAIFFWVINEGSDFA